MNDTPAFELKGRLLTLTVLRLFEPHVVNLAMALKAKVEQAPGFFDNTPVVLDLEPLQDGHKVIDFPALVSLLGNHGLLVSGVLGGNEKQRRAAADAGLGLFSDRQRGAEPPQPAPEPAPAAEPEPRPEPEPEPEPPARPATCSARLVTQPVRSGQQIYARGGDLVVLAPVSAGAEIIADGHIHVYAPLRGRAIAGAAGDVDARIFCQSLEAELVSINGVYQIKEDLEQGVPGTPVQIHRQNDNLIIRPL